ncbi:MAG: hypothetical protein ACPGXK_07865 [Phycisphaerae bacterium]
MTFTRTIFSFVFLLGMITAPAARGFDPVNGDWTKTFSTDVRVMTYNVEDGIRSNINKTSTLGNWAAIVRQVAAFKPDILILQETGDIGVPGGVDSVSELETVLDLFLYGGPDPFVGGTVTQFVQAFDPTFDLPHVFVSFNSDGFNRNVIMSRYPFVDLNGDGKATISDLLNLTADEYQNGGDGGIRGFMFAEIDLPDDQYTGDLVIGNAHLKSGGSSSDRADRLEASQNTAYFVDYFYNGAGTGSPDPNNKIFDMPNATSILGPDTPVIIGGDWNEDELTNGRRGPAAWMTEAEFAGSTDGTDRDRSDATYDSAVEFCTGNRSTQSSSKLDYIAWQDSIATPRVSFVFNSSSVGACADFPPEFSGFFPPGGITGLASDHRPVIVDFILPLGKSLCSGVDCTFLDDDCAVGVCNPLTGECEQNTQTFNGSVCRDAVDSCDEEELCDGVNPECPVDECRIAGISCGVGLQCDGECNCEAPAGACCQPNGTCVIVDSDRCESAGGFFYGNFTDCDGPLDPPCLASPTVVSCELSSPTVDPGGSVDVQLFVEDVSDLAAYQMTIDVATMGTGIATLDCGPCTGAPNVPGCGVRIDEGRADWIFDGLNAISAPNCDIAAGGSLLIAGSTSAAPGSPEYLVEYTLDISGDAVPGTQFEITIDQADGQSTLNNSLNEFIPFQGEICTITVRGEIPPGACCGPGGICTEISEDDCNTAGGFFYGAATSCSDPLDPPCEPTPLVTCVPDSNVVVAGSTVDFDLVVESVEDLAAYQMTIDVTANGTGTATVECGTCVGGPNDPGCGVRVDESRGDYIFDGLSSIPAVNCNDQAGGALLISGASMADTGDPRYLIEYTLTISGDAGVGSEFTVDVDQSDFQSTLNDSMNEFIDFDSQACVFTVIDPSGCQLPQVASGGSKSILVTPQGVQSQALLIEGDGGDPDVACVSLYVQADGSLDVAPFFQAPAAWGTVVVRDEALIPGTSYSVTAECLTGSAPPVSFDTWVFGDLNNDSFANLADTQLAVQAFQANFANVTPEQADVDPACSPNGVNNLADAFVTVQAFQGQSYGDVGCPVPCP